MPAVVPQPRDGREPRSREAFPGREALDEPLERRAAFLGLCRLLAGRYGSLEVPDVPLRELDPASFGLFRRRSLAREVGGVVAARLQQARDPLPVLVRVLRG